MIFEIVDLSDLSGTMAKIYSVIIMDGKVIDDESLYDSFTDTYMNDYPDEVQDIYDALKTMGSHTGLRSNRIIPFEGVDLGDGIVALCNRPNKILRTYSIMYGETVAIVGGGGPKPGGGALRDYPPLDEAQKLIKRIKRILNLAQAAGDLSITSRGLTSTTKFIYNSADYE